MLLNLTDLSDEPLQSQIVRQIRAHILAGDLRAGDSLPSIRGLAREQKVSVITVQRAYEILMQEGIIHSRRGKGFFVSKLQDSEKEEIAKDKLYNNIQRSVNSAVTEGLKAKDIHIMIDEILRDSKDE
ncbi:MAG: GntR family transcriptional regulator [bacterium]